jgi:hypothetical protein
VTNNPTTEIDILGLMSPDSMERYAKAHACKWASMTECVPIRTNDQQTSPGTPAAQKPSGPSAPSATPLKPEVETPDGDTTTLEDRHAKEAQAGFDLFFDVLGAVGAVVNAIRPLLFLFGALGTIILVLGTLAGIASTVYSCAKAIFGNHKGGDIIGCAIGALSIALGFSSQYILGAIKDGAEAVKSADQAIKAFGISLDALDQLIGWLS